MIFFDKILMSPFLRHFRYFFSKYYLRLEANANYHRCLEYLNIQYEGNHENLAFCQFGVGNGRSLIDIYNISQKYNNLKGMTFFGFDSFQGLPATNHQSDLHPYWKAGDYSDSIEAVHSNMRKNGLPSSSVIFIPGFFEQTMNLETFSRHKIKKIIYAHIDCDYYTSTKTVLNFIKPFLAKGAVLDFDDFYCYPDKAGEEKALSEWLSENDDIEIREFNRYNTFSKSFTISLKK